MIRKARIEELPQIMEIFQSAKMFMHRSGNDNQWVHGYPSSELITKDILGGNFYVEENEGEITGCFAFFTGVEPTYAKIEGEWLDDEPYGTIHRLASDGSRPGFADRCFDYCSTIIPNLRVDTHKDNLPMEAALNRNGFQFCGIITLANGSPRLAYQRTTRAPHKSSFEP